jgi:hypothetical protein
MLTQGKNRTSAQSANSPYTGQIASVGAQTRMLTLMCDAEHTKQVKTSSNSL